MVTETATNDSAALSNVMSFLMSGKQPSVEIEAKPVVTHYLFEGPMGDDEDGDE